MTYCKKVTYDSGKGKDSPSVILGTIKSVREGDTTFKEVTTGRGKKLIRSDMIISVEDTNEMFKIEQGGIRL